MTIERSTRRRRSRGAGAGESAAIIRPRPEWRRLRHRLAPQGVFSDDEVAAMHDTALRVLEELGMVVSLPEARALFRGAGALVDEDTHLVRIGRDIVEAALASAPKSIRLRAANPAREQDYELGACLFLPGGGCPNVTDREKGRRPGSLADYRDAIRLHQAFDAIHALGPSTEPQDIPVHLRHYAMTRAQLELSDKPMFLYARGRGQVEDGFEMVRLAHGLDTAGFEDGAWVFTIINTNSPRLLDIPMAQGIIDFARAGQMSVITPFCLAGAMAPITVAGAITLQHAEAMAGIALAQIARPGAPVSNGGFSSNVDMKSGSPAFGTPDHVKLTLGAGQLARHIGLPFRTAAGAASCAADAQGAAETANALWGAMLAQGTMIVHAAGWLEGGLTFGYEKFVTDMESVHLHADLMARRPAADADEIGFDAIAATRPAGHFFDGPHTMSRYRDAFLDPVVADYANFGTWSEAGARTAEQRATDIWRRILAEHAAPPGGTERAGRVEDFIARRSEAGGAPPVD
jgi:trimethylamine--corrinoid protein Co-methyltransferase